MITNPYPFRVFLMFLCLTASWAGCESGGGQKTTPAITWATPSAITYGTALSSTQLNATASVPGTFVYTPAAGVVPNAGTQTLSTTFTPTDTTKYTTATASVSLTVNKATPTITWATPAAIDSATPLSATQLDASASVAGTFVYTPAAGTLLSAGTQTLSVAFTPTDSANYNSASATVSIVVNAVVTSGIGPSGGTVNGFYGASVTVPAGALSSNVDIQIPRDSTGAPAMPASGVDSAGAMYALLPHGTSFTTPVTVQIPFDSTRIPTDADPVLYKGEPGGAFAPIPTTINGNFLSADVSNFSWVIPGYASTLPRMVYALTSGANGISVSSFKMDKTFPTLSAATSSAPVGNGPISVTVHPSRRFLFVTNGGSSVPGTATNVPANSISVYQVDPVTGAVSGPTDTQPINGNPISVVVHPTGKFVYVVNEVRFGSPIGNISVFSIDKTTGALTPEGTAADSGGAPASALAFAPSGEFAYVTYFHAAATPVGNTFWDTVKTFHVSTTSGLFSSPIGSAPTGDNPWALAVTRGGHFAYVASLSTQGSVNELSIYSVDQTSGTLTLQNSLSMQGAQPSSLAMDPESRFLYVGTQQTFNNQNVQVFSINPTNGGLTLVSTVLAGNGGPGPISVTADPQGQFVFVEDLGDGSVVPYVLNSTTGSLSPGPAVGGIFLGGASGGVGDPFFFAASGTSPVWQNNCTIVVNDVWVFDGCPVGFLSTGPTSSNGGSSGGGGGTPPPPAATFVLQVITDSPGASFFSTPAGINYNPATTANTFLHAFPNGSLITLTAVPPDTANAYDVHWSGACSGDTPTTQVTMTEDQHCYVTFTQVSLR